MSNVRHVILLAFAALLTAFSVSCASTAKFNYAKSPVLYYQAEALPMKLPPVTVLPFRDLRPAVLHAKRAQEKGETPSAAIAFAPTRGTFRTGWIPLLPFSWISRETPESGDGQLATLRRFWCTFDRELAEAAAISIERSRIFREVKSAERIEDADTKLVFQGFLKKTRYQGNRITYGVTYLLAPILWTIGMPNALSKNELGVTFRLYDAQNKETLWRYDFDESKSTLHFLYANLGADAEGYADLMRLAMNAALHDLQQKLEEHAK